jgi:hypothetical protein
MTISVFRATCPGCVSMSFRIRCVCLTSSRNTEEAMQFDAGPWQWRHDDVPPSCGSWRGAWRARGRSRRRRRAGGRRTWRRRSLQQQGAVGLRAWEVDGREWCLPGRTGSGNLNLTGEVALLGRSLDVGGGLDHGDVEVLALAAAAVHLGEPHGGGVLDGAARLAPALVHRRRAHRRRPRRRPARSSLCCPFAPQVVAVAAGRGSRVAGFSF